MKFKSTFLSSILAGVVFSFSSAVTLVGQNTDALSVALMYPVGLIIILMLDLGFFSKKIGYLFTDPKMFDNHFEEIPVLLIGNCAGAIISGIILHPVFEEQFYAAALSYTSTHFLITLASAFFCGILMFIAIHAFTRTNGSGTGIFITFLAAAMIGFCKFDYYLTDLFYFAGALRFSTTRMWFLVFSIFGNFAGAYTFAAIYDAQKSKKKRRHHSHHHHHNHHHHHHQEESDGTEETSAEENK